MATELPIVREQDFEAAVVFCEYVVLRLSGSSNVGAAAPLQQLVDRLHSELCDASAAEVVVDIVGLEFMNAACFNVFVAWIGLINELGPERRYRLRFKSNSTIRWQARSLHTLSCFATDLVSIGEHS